MPAHMMRTSLSSSNTPDTSHFSQNTAPSAAHMVSPSVRSSEEKAKIESTTSPILAPRVKRRYNRKASMRLAVSPEGSQLPQNVLTTPAPICSPDIHNLNRSSMLHPPTNTLSAEDLSSDSGSDDDLRMPKKFLRCAYGTLKLFPYYFHIFLF